MGHAFILECHLTSPLVSLPVKARVGSRRAGATTWSLALGGAAPGVVGAGERGASPAPHGDPRNAESSGRRLVLRDRRRRPTAAVRSAGRAERDPRACGRPPAADRVDVPVARA